MKKTAKIKKILFMSRLFHPHIGGVEKHILEISRLLIEKGYEVTVLTERHEDKLALKENLEGINVIRIPIKASEKNKKFEIWKWITNNRKFIKSFDIVHVHDVFFWMFPIIIGFDMSKVFVTFHGYEGYPVKLRHKTLRKIAEMSSAGNICVGDFMKKWYGAKADSVTYGATKMYKQVNEPQNNLSSLFFGRLDDQTGIKEYYLAFSKIKKEKKRFSMDVFGEGKYAKTLKKATVKPFEKHIENKIPKYRFIFVSRYLSMIEAMIQKRMVIAVYTDPIKKDYLLNSPFKNYVDVCSTSDEIAERVKYYIDNPSKEKEKVDKAYEWAKQQTWEKITDKYIKLWQK